MQVKNNKLQKNPGERESDAIVKWHLTIDRQLWKAGTIFKETSCGKDKFLNTKVMRAFTFMHTM